MSIEKGSLKDWDDRHYQSIDDLPPEAWDAMHFDDFKKREDRSFIAQLLKDMRGHDIYQVAAAIQEAGFKRD